VNYVLSNGLSAKPWYVSFLANN